MFAAALLRQGRVLDAEACLTALEPAFRSQNVAAVCLAFTRWARGELTLAARDLEKAALLRPNYELDLIKSFILAGEGRFLEAKAARLAMRQAMQANSVNQISILGLRVISQLLNFDANLNNYIQYDKNLGDQVPNPDFKKIADADFGLGFTSLIAADYFLAKRCYVCATRCYETRYPRNPG